MQGIFRDFPNSLPVYFVLTLKKKLLHLIANFSILYFGYMEQIMIKNAKYKTTNSNQDKVTLVLNWDFKLQQMKWAESKSSSSSSVQNPNVHFYQIRIDWIDIFEALKHCAKCKNEKKGWRSNFEKSEVHLFLVFFYIAWVIRIQKLELDGSQNEDGDYGSDFSHAFCHVYQHNGPNWTLWSYFCAARSPMFRLSSEVQWKIMRKYHILSSRGHGFLWM